MLKQWLILKLPKVSYAIYYLYTKDILYIVYYTMHVLSRSVMSDSLGPQGLYPTRILCPWEFSRQEFWSGLPCTPPGDLPNSGIEPTSLSLLQWQVGVLLLASSLPLPTWEAPYYAIWIKKIPWGREWQPTPVFLPGEFHGQRSLATVHGIEKNRT